MKHLIFLLVSVSLPMAVLAQKSVEEMIAECREKRDVGLELSGAHITEIPMALCQLKQLKRLVLLGNQLEHLPKEMAQIKFLSSLDVRENPLNPLDVEFLQVNLPNCKIKVVGKREE